MKPRGVASDYNRIAFRASGGKVKAIFWHLGVRLALEARGFRFRTGYGPRSDPAPGEIGLMISSSAGTIFSLLTAAGCDASDLLNSFLGLESKVPPIDSSVIFHRNRPTLRGYLRRVESALNLRLGQKFFPGTSVIDDPELRFAPELEAPERPVLQRLRRLRLADLMALRAPYSLSRLEQWLGEELLAGHDRFEDFRMRLFFLATDLDGPRVLALGPLSEEREWYRYVSGVLPSRAAVASMAIPSVFNPIPIELDGRRTYCIDGDVYNPHEPMIETDHDCDQPLTYIESDAPTLPPCLPGWWNFYGSRRKRGCVAFNVCEGLPAESDDVVGLLLTRSPTPPTTFSICRTTLGSATPFTISGALLVRHLRVWCVRRGSAHQQPLSPNPRRLTILSQSSRAAYSGCPTVFFARIA